MAAKTIFPSQNVYIANSYPNHNFDNSSYLYFSQYSRPGDIYRTLMRFSLRSIPPCRRIEGAWLLLTVYRNEIPVGTVINCGLQRVLGPWSEQNVTWNDQPDFKRFTNFSTSFADMPGTVIKKDVTSLVRSWYRRVRPNFGLMLTGNEFTNSLVGFYSTNFTDITVWPRLVVVYGKH